MIKKFIVSILMTLRSICQQFLQMIGVERDKHEARDILHSLGGRGRVQIHNYSCRNRGLARIADYVIRWEAMVNEKAKHKARVLSFCAFFELSRELWTLRSNVGYLRIWLSTMEVIWLLSSSLRMWTAAWSNRQDTIPSKPRFNLSNMRQQN